MVAGYKRHLSQVKNSMSGAYFPPLPQVPADIADDRRFAPATQRNREPILAELRKVLPAQGLVLEVASGTGEHATYLAPHFPMLSWQPTDADAGCILSIAAWSRHLQTSNVLPPLSLDVEQQPWPVLRADAVVNINMLHIAPQSATTALMRGAAQVLAPSCPLVLYGPFRIDGQHTAPSNQAFDEGLRAMNPEWGVRDLGEVTRIAAHFGLKQASRVPMPSNNFVVIFRRQ